MTPEHTESHYKTVLLALLAGATAGVTVGVLMAPKSGAKLRADIGSAAEGYLQSARQESEDLQNSAADLARRGMNYVQRSKDAATNKVREAVFIAADAGAKDAHGAIDHAVAAMNAGATKSHEMVNDAANALARA